jgi:hypothetical protein
MKKTIDKEWQGFVKACFPPDLDPVQLIDLRRTFYGGASALYGMIMQCLSPGDEPTEADLQMMRDIQTELQDFNEMVKAGKA